MICNTYKMFFGTLADETKFNIINSLKKGPKNVSELGKQLKLEQSRVSHNLRRLRDLGFVTVEKQGKQRIYSLEQGTITKILNMVDKHVDTYYKHYCKCVGEDKKKRWDGR